MIRIDYSILPPTEYLSKMSELDVALLSSRDLREAGYSTSLVPKLIPVTVAMEFYQWKTYSLLRRTALELRRSLYYDIQVLAHNKRSDVVIFQWRKVKRMVTPELKNTFCSNAHRAMVVSLPWSSYRLC